MSFRVSTFSLPKRGHEPSENQDAFRPFLPSARERYAVERSSDWQKPELVAAIADGATEGMLSDLWARILVARAKQLFLEEGSRSLLTNSSRVWRRFKHYKARAGKPLTQLPDWLAEPRLEQGAFSTLVAVCLSEDQTWTAKAVGDSCLFQIRASNLLVHWPIQTAAEFSKSPYLLCSEQDAGPMLDAHTYSVHGQWEADDYFLLMSDALACWFHGELEKGHRPWHNLLTLDEAGGFEALITQWRESGELRNDDVTLVRIHVR